MRLQASICLGCIGNIGTTRQAIGGTSQKPKQKTQSNLVRTVKVPEDMEYEQIEEKQEAKSKNPIISRQKLEH